MVTGSHGMGNDSFLGYLAVLNRLWDGGEIHQDRKQALSVHVEGRRLTVGLMIQPAVLRDLMQRGGGLSRGSGFLARYLVSEPRSTMGERLYSPPAKNEPKLSEFQRRITELLDTDLPVDDQGRLTPPVLRLSDGAFSVWRDYHDSTERALGKLGELHAICDFAAKSADNAARIAACFHLFEGAQGAISAETMRRAAAVAGWYLKEALRVMDLADELQALSDARLLDAWLAAKGDHSTREVLQKGPSALRRKERLNAAIGLLEDAGRARVQIEGRQKTLVRNPSLSDFVTATADTSATESPPIGGGRSESVASVAGVAVAARRNGEVEETEL
jgi:putative DNA primase/helicase